MLLLLLLIDESMLLVGVFTLGEAQSFCGLTSKIQCLILTSTPKQRLRVTNVKTAVVLLFMTAKCVSRSPSYPEWGNHRFSTAQSFRTLGRLTGFRVWFYTTTHIHGSVFLLQLRKALLRSQVSELDLRLGAQSQHCS